MRKKSTVYSPEFHNQYQRTEDQIRSDKAKIGGTKSKEEKEGQSKYRIGEATKKQDI